jgi:hypothetical protein
MKIKFHQSGGYLGLVRGVELDTDAMSKEEAAELESLVKQSDILKAKGRLTRKLRDSGVYEITIETDKGVHRVLFDDLNKPKGASSLLKYLQSRAKPEPLK